MSSDSPPPRGTTPAATPRTFLPPINGSFGGGGGPGTQQPSLPTAVTITTEALQQIETGKCTPLPKPPAAFLYQQKVLREMLELAQQIQKGNHQPINYAAIVAPPPPPPMDAKAAASASAKLTAKEQALLMMPPGPPLTLNRFNEVPDYPPEEPNWDGVVRSINLRETFIGPENCIAIARKMINNPTVRMLDLSQCDMGPAAGVELFSCLKRNHHRTLETLNVSGNNLDVSVANAFAEYLAEDKTLIECNFSCNDIRDDGLLAIADSLRSNHHLQFLSIRGNNVTDIGALALKSAMEQQEWNSLVAVWFQLNPAISEPVQKELMQLLVEKCPKPPEFKKKKKKGGGKKKK